MTEQANAIGPSEPAKDADVDFGGLAVRVSRHDTLAEGFQVEPVKRHRFERTGEGIFASIRLRAWYPAERFQNARP